MIFEKYKRRSCRKGFFAESEARAPAGKNNWLGAVLCAAVAFGLSLPAQAAGATSDSDLSKLEIKLFRHEYHDSVEARLERLEKMVFGEAKSGPEEERIKNLVTAIPDPPPEEENKAEASPAGAEPPSRWAGDTEKSVAGDLQPEDGSKYPAVTAIEKRVFGKDFAQEPVGKRLDRLEAKVFGHASGIDDLSERVDRLKQRTGIDIARQAPPGTDWADDDDDPGGPARGPVAGSGGEDGRSFSGRDLRSDLGVPADGITDRWAGTGSYGMAGVVPPRPRSSMPPEPVQSFVPPATGQPVGLNQQVGALEQEIFGKTYVRDALPARLSRLETTVFPQQKPATEKSLPDRVSRLLAVVPLSSGQRSIAQGGGRKRLPDPDFADFDDLLDKQQASGAQAKGGSGLSKIINSIGSFLTGGYSGGYPVAPNGVVTDPQTGLWIDPRTGSLIDPVTGAVVGQRAMQQGAGSMMNGFGSFSNGFAPFGTAPYGTGYGTGMHFGFGGIGRYGYGGMWP